MFFLAPCKPFAAQGGIAVGKAAKLFDDLAIVVKGGGKRPDGVAAVKIGADTLPEGLALTLALQVLLVTEGQAGKEHVHGVHLFQNARLVGPAHH